MQTLIRGKGRQQGYCRAQGTTFHILRYTTIVKNVKKNACACVYLSHVAMEWKLARHCKSAACVCSVAQSRLMLCDPMDCSLPGSSAHGNFQARILESVATSYSKINYTPIR